MNLDTPNGNALLTAVDELVAASRQRGRVTDSEVYDKLPPNRFSSDQLGEALARLAKLDVKIVCTGDHRSDRTLPWVQTYLGETSRIDPLSRKSEIAIIRRIDAGREKMIGALCESPLTKKTIQEWRADLLAKRAQPHEIIGTDTTKELTFESEAPRDLSKKQREATASLTASEELRVSEIIRRLDGIIDACNRLRAERLAIFERGRPINPRREKGYEKVRRELVEKIMQRRFNGAQIEALVERHYELARQLAQLEGRLLSRAIGGKIGGKASHRSNVSRRDVDEANDIRSQMAKIAETSQLPIGELRRIADLVRDGERESNRAKKEMVEATLGLVISIAGQFAHDKALFLELIHQGNNGLIRAVDHFDYRRRYGFSPWAAWWIRRELTTFVVNTPPKKRRGAARPGRLVN